MKHATLIAVAWLMGAAPAWGEDAPAAKKDVRAAVLEALEEKASPPLQRPELPDRESDRAREVQATTAGGKKDAAERTAHELAGKHAAEHASKAQVEAAEQPERGASSAARAANAESRAAAARDRSNRAKGRDDTGNGNGNGHGNGKPNP